MSLERNRQDSSANLSEHVQSISNITSDASNLERINRWQAAIRLYQDHPFFEKFPEVLYYLKIYFGL